MVQCRAPDRSSVLIHNDANVAESWCVSKIGHNKNIFFNNKLFWIWVRFRFICVMKQRRTTLQPHILGQSLSFKSYTTLYNYLKASWGKYRWNKSYWYTKILRLSLQSVFNTGLFAKEIPPNHILLDNAHNLGPLISRWEINKFENCWFKSVRILEVLKLLFQQCLNLSSSQQDMRGPILGDLSNNRGPGGTLVIQDLENLHEYGISGY